jgi:hypothetical protein
MGQKLFEIHERVVQALSLLQRKSVELKTATLIDRSASLRTRF